AESADGGRRRDAPDAGPTTAPPEALPAGSEVWVEATADGRWSVAGRPPRVCPAEAVGVV
ncbi:MAG TPA: hypothetical protein VHM02_13975, partial [Thermoanaerobaculia bacterium]|nr:hypothetical protein [Thermoanaerobaculia bacterium]